MFTDIIQFIVEFKDLLKEIKDLIKEDIPKSLEQTACTSDLEVGIQTRSYLKLRKTIPQNLGFYISFTVLLLSILFSVFISSFFTVFFFLDMPLIIYCGYTFLTGRPDIGDRFVQYYGPIGCVMKAMDCPTIKPDHDFMDLAMGNSRLPFIDAYRMSQIDLNEDEHGLFDLDWWTDEDLGRFMKLAASYARLKIAAGGRIDGKLEEEFMKNTNADKVMIEVMDNVMKRKDTIVHEVETMKDTNPDVSKVMESIRNDNEVFNTDETFNEDMPDPHEYDPYFARLMDSINRIEGADENLREIAINDSKTRSIT